MPVVSVETKEYSLLIPSLTNLQASDLKRVAGNIASHQEPIAAAFDDLFPGA